MFQNPTGACAESKLQNYTRDAVSPTKPISFQFLDHRKHSMSFMNKSHTHIELGRICSRTKFYMVGDLTNPLGMLATLNENMSSCLENAKCSVHTLTIPYELQPATQRLSS